MKLCLQTVQDRLLLLWASQDLREKLDHRVLQVQEQVMYLVQAAAMWTTGLCAMMV
jgi:hypothetical protein